MSNQPEDTQSRTGAEASVTVAPDTTSPNGETVVLVVDQPGVSEADFIAGVSSGDTLAPIRMEPIDDTSSTIAVPINGSFPPPAAPINGSFPTPTTPLNELSPAIVVPGKDPSTQPSGGAPTSWYKKACKEVMVSSVERHLHSSRERLRHRGLEYEVGPDKVPTVFTSQDNLWNGTPQVLNYFFMDGTPTQHEKVTTVIDEWTWYANVRFHKASSPEDSNIRIRFDTDDGSWSYVGQLCNRSAITDATMNLAWLDRFSPLSANEKAVILHEFGHVLGLLHEHQSPAHGGYAVKNIQAALDLYQQTQGWTSDQIYNQVIRVYGNSDISNFPRFDIKSIMHYPQPKELTGLDYDIGYNEKLTDLDKAYMILQYPRAEVHPQAARQGWNFKKALQVIHAPPEVTRQVLSSILTDRDNFTGEISPVNIRRILKDWCLSVYKGSDATKPASTISSAHVAFNARQVGQATAEVRDGEDLCATDGSNNAGAGPSHAVMDEDTLWPLPADHSLTTLKTYFTVRAVDLSTGQPVQVTSDQEKMVLTAANTWSAHAGVEFVLADPGQIVDLVIQFNNAVDVDPEGYPRSTCSMPSGESKVRRASDETRKIWTNLKADIQYHGIFPLQQDAVKYKSAKYNGQTDCLDGYTLNMRSIIHELGHWLGLRHEYCGLYGYWMHSSMGRSDDKAFNERRAKTFWSTRYDAGSVMDSIGIGLDDTAMNVLKLKGLQPASVTHLQDKGNVINRVNVSVTLSPYDEANIALLYPSALNLVEVTNSSMKLKPAKNDADQSLLQQMLMRLQLYTDANFWSIAEHLQAGRWQSARKAYLDIVKMKQTQEVESRNDYNQFIADRLVATPTQIKGVFDVGLKVPVGSEPQRAHDIGITPLRASDPAAENPVTSPQPVPSGPGSFVFELYNKLSTMFCPGGEQYFALQFPSRFLDKQTFAYKLDGHFSRFNKPVTVNESEFGLTDALYPIAPIVGGPNGMTLSRNYSKALDSLIPTLEDVDVRKQREKMRAWLMEETKAGNTAYTVDTRLAIPGIDASTAKELSDAHGMTITAGPMTGNTINRENAKEMAKQAIEAVENSHRTNPRGMTRIEYADSLMQAYLNDRKVWELQRDDMIREASEQVSIDPSAMEKLTRRLAHITAIEEAKLGSKYADAVVRGNSHTVREFMGHIDIKTTAEMLQDSKDALRESALSSLYTASSVYPVAMQPTDWFEALDTGFTREELSQDLDLIKAAVQAKGKLVDALENQIANLREFDRGDPDVAEEDMKKAAARREAATIALSRSYTASTISAVKLAIQAVAVVTPAGAAVGAASRGLKKIKALGDGDETKKGLKAVLGDNLEGLDDIGTQMDELTEANADVNSASRGLTESMGNYASAVTGNTREMIYSLQRQLTMAKKDLAELEESHTIACRAKLSAPAAPGSLADVGKLPTGNGGSRWSEIRIQSTVNNDYTKVDNSSSASVSDFKCNFWIGSHSDSSSTAQADNSTQATSSALGVDVSMRVTYVTVDRAGWFDPSLFEMSKSFMRGSKNDYTPWAAWKAGLTVEQAAEAVRNNSPDKPTGYLAGFPVGYILVKDCVIRVTSHSTDSSAFKLHFDKQSESSSGFLCFSHSGGSRSSADGSMSSTVSAEGGVVVRIPGPQILGYMMQLTAKDQSQTFKATPLEDILVADAADPIKSPSEDGSTAGPAHSVGPKKWSEEGRGSQATVRKYDDDFGSGEPVSSSDSSTVPQPAHEFQQSDGAQGRSGHMVDALQTALDDSDVSAWLRAQSPNAKEELWAKLTEAFGKVKA